MSAAISDVSPRYPEIDFATDAVPELHAVLRELRTEAPVVPVRYHGGTAYLITRFLSLIHI